jgi:hypothetical protein
MTNARRAHEKVCAQAWAGDQVKDRVQTETQAQIQTQTQMRDQDRIYGSELMTEPERAEHRAQLRNLKTEQEREAFRMQHHEKMKERATARGLALPDDPPAQGKGQGVGASTGHGASMAPAHGTRKSPGMGQTSGNGKGRR